MTWADCINPFNKPKHGYWFNCDNFFQTQLFASKICKVCWIEAQRLVNNPQPLSLNKNPKPLREMYCGPDML